MKKGIKKGKPKAAQEYYLEAIILKLDRVEAELEMVKTVISGYGSQIKDKIENLIENKKID